DLAGPGQQIQVMVRPVQPGAQEDVLGQAAHEEGGRLKAGNGFDDFKHGHSISGETGSGSPRCGEPDPVSPDDSSFKTLEYAAVDVALTPICHNSSVSMGEWRPDWEVMMSATVHGIHHVTAIAGDPQVNLDFYSGVLGQRLVKKSVNQDVIDTYHLFYADNAGSPGTDLTFFPWPDMEPARLGHGFTVEVPFAIRQGSLACWHARLAAARVAVGALETRFGETTLPFRDPHGLPLALVEIGVDRPFVPWAESPVPAEHQLRGMHTVRLWERSLEPTELLLTRVMGFAPLGVEDGWHRYGIEGGASGRLVEVKEMPAERRGAWGTGGVHHVAWRVRDLDEQTALRGMLAQVG